MSLDRTFARLVTHHRRALCAWRARAARRRRLLTIVFGVHFASDVLDLLPQHFDAVHAFKTFDREFSQARELTFGLLDEKHEVDLDAFAEHFAEELAQGAVGRSA